MGEDWELNHVGLIATNRNAVLSHLQRLGVGLSVGPQPLLPHEDGEGSLMYWRTLTGEPVTSTYATGGAHNFRDGESQIGDCQLECIAMKPGPGSFFTEYLAAQGPGINHICFNTPRIEEETAFFLERGCELTFDARVNGRTVENYLDTRAHGDLMISLRPPPTDWERAWKANNRAHPLVPDWRFMGLGFGVADVDATVEYYASMGFEPQGGMVEDAQFGVRRRAVGVGSLIFEFCQPSGAHSVYADSLRVRGDGVNDLVFSVADLEAERARLGARGGRILRGSEDATRVFVDTREAGNIMVQLVQA